MEKPRKLPKIRPRAPPLFLTPMPYTVLISGSIFETLTWALHQEDLQNSGELHPTVTSRVLCVDIPQIFDEG
jgi:hypothetical protein